ncbi:hypothetical protein V5F77_22020 [Xanthobacter sp. DSM 24535]
MDEVRTVARAAVSGVQGFNRVPSADTVPTEAITPSCGAGMVSAFVPD